MFLAISTMAFFKRPTNVEININLKGQQKIATFVLAIFLAFATLFEINFYFKASLIICGASAITAFFTSFVALSAYFKNKVLNDANPWTTPEKSRHFFENLNKFSKEQLITFFGDEVFQKVTSLIFRDHFENSLTIQDLKKRFKKPEEQETFTFMLYVHLYEALGYEINNLQSLLEHFLFSIPLKDHLIYLPPKAMDYYKVQY